MTLSKAATEGESQEEFRAYDTAATPGVADKDRSTLPWVLKFNPYDLYSKGHAKPDLKQLKPYYDGLFAEFLPQKVAWKRAFRTNVSFRGRSAFVPNLLKRSVSTMPHE